MATLSAIWDKKNKKIEFNGRLGIEHANSKKCIKTTFFLDEYEKDVKRCHVTTDNKGEFKSFAIDISEHPPKVEIYNEVRVTVTVDEVEKTAFIDRQCIDDGKAENIPFE